MGLVKKFAVADLLTSLTDHLNYSDIAQAERWILLVWLFAYGWKIYFDFSAYSDIAIGSGRLFGISIPENFDWPYFRTNITDFWRHWHISLYNWLVDYVFVPLGGSRVSSIKLYRNIMLVMFVSGVWHGAGANYVVWGLCHGIFLCVHRWLRVWESFPISGPYSKFAGWLATYLAVNFAWAFFAMDMQTATFFFKRIFLG
jgi:alginate O-acetyltransferase complex protein AlgI